MRKIAIIGVGNVGSTTAHTLIERNLVDELVLFDQHKKIVFAEINDLIDGQIGRSSQTKLIEPSLTELTDCDIIIFSAGDISLLQGTSDRFIELNFTKKVAKEWGQKIKESGFKGILVNITNPCDVITQYLQQITGLPKNQVFGTGTTLDTSRMRHAVSQKLNVHPSSIEGYVLGEHGESQFVAWSSVRIAGIPIEENFSQTELDELEVAARKGGWITFSGKGYTSFGIANAASTIVEAILNDSQLIAPVSNYNDTNQAYVGHPAQISSSGIVKDFDLSLNTLEKQKWQKTIETIHFMYNSI
ncbi:lactate/malate family dehydrogenase [Enterococcus sp. AZ103]|uniref:lactate/malate family dehydrogenase n=1 Tax=Enterococcus sp. AZ103 TaxID=2774628 RepID=UPI003F221C8D